VAFAYLSRRKPSAIELDKAPQLAADAPQSDHLAFSREATRRLYTVLGKLDPKYRIAFALHVMDGRPMQEVATMTEASLVATKSRVWRARREVTKHAKRDAFLATYLEGQETKP